MRILKIVNGFDDGGVFASECSYIVNYQNEGVIVFLVIIGNGDKTKTYQGLVENSLVLPMLNTSLNGGLFKKLKEIAKTFKYGNTFAKKVVSTFNVKFDGIIYRRPVFLFLGGIIGRKLKARVFWHMPNVVNSQFSRKFYEIFLPYYRITPVANSTYTKTTLSKLCRDIVYPGFDPERVVLSTSSYRDELGIPDNAPVFGMAGRICPDKAQDILIEAFLKSKAPERGAHLVLAGKLISNEFENILNSIGGNHIGSNIHFLGRIDDLPKFYSTINIALNSRRNVEPFGISIVEAIAAGKPVLAYYFGGPSEIIEDGKTGWLLSGNDVDTWVDGFNFVMDKQNDWQLIGEYAKKSADKYSVINNVRKFIKILES